MIFDFASMKVDNTDIVKLSINDYIIWQKTKPTPPTPTEGDVVLTFADGTVRVDTYEDGIVPANKYAYLDDVVGVKIGKNIKTIEIFAFRSTLNITKVEFESIEQICSTNFMNAQSNPLNFNAHLYINGTEITDLIIPSSITNIGNYAFTSSGYITSVTIPDSVVSIGEEAFGYLEKLPSIKLPNNLTNISDYTFFGCYDLASVTIPDSVVRIGDSAFANCLILKTVIYSGTIEQWNNITKGRSWKTYVPYNCVVYCTDGQIRI